jgi:hypothetical protein
MDLWIDLTDDIPTKKLGNISEQSSAILLVLRLSLLGAVNTSYGHDFFDL